MFRLTFENHRPAFSTVQKVIREILAPFRKLHIIETSNFGGAVKCQYYSLRKCLTDKSLNL